MKLVSGAYVLKSRQILVQWTRTSDLTDTETCSVVKVLAVVKLLTQPLYHTGLIVLGNQVCTAQQSILWQHSSLNLAQPFQCVATLATAGMHTMSEQTLCLGST